LIRDCVEQVAAGIGKLEYRDPQGQVITEKALQSPDRLVKTTVADVLPQYKNLMITTYYSSLTTSQNLADNLALTMIAGKGWQQSRTFFKDIEAVTPAQIQECARKFLQGTVFWGYGSSKENLEKVSPAQLNGIWKKQAKPAEPVTSERQ
jgi:predicted Zn-dependent peptidase